MNPKIIKKKNCKKRFEYNINNNNHSENNHFMLIIMSMREMFLANPIKNWIKT